MDIDEKQIGEAQREPVAHLEIEAVSIRPGPRRDMTDW
jgi:hypothetical protein